MPASNRGRIAITTGTFSEECVTQNDLIANQAVYPEIRNFLDIVNRRQLCTLLTSGVVTPYGIKNDERTKIPNVEGSSQYAGRGIGTNAYQFRSIGRIEQPSVILSQVGATTADGWFTLKMGDRHLNKGAVVLFYGNRFVATVMSQPRGSAGNYIYDFQSPSGDLFSWATHVAPQSGTKTCFSGWTSFGEKSLRGYGESKFPDMFINHMTIQRDTVSITGDAASRVLWVNYTSANGKTDKGWMYEEVAQQSAKFSIKNEREKWFGVSNMKDANGSLRSTSRQIDPETGLEITTGDGWEEQVAGGNVAYGSGTNGRIVLNDISDMMSTLKKKGNQVTGYNWVAVTGTDGFVNFQEIAVTLAGNQNTTFFQDINQGDKAGGTDMNIGFTCGRINIAGNTLTVIQHPMFDDDLAFPERGNDGKLKLSSTMFIMNLGMGSNKNMEILHKEANGINRAWVQAKLNGMTGAPETIITQEDAMSFALLKQDMLCVYDTQTEGIIYPNT